MTNFIVKNGLDVANGSLVVNSSSLTYNLLYSNGSAFIVGNSSVNTYITSNNIVVNGSSITSVNTSFSYTFSNTISFSNTITFGNSSVNTTINSTSFSGISNAALNANSSTYISTNSTNFYSAVSLTSAITANASTSYTNAIAFASNISNISSGSLQTASYLGTTLAPQFSSIGIGTPATGGNSLVATGNIYAYYTSDQKLKKNVTKLKNALSKIRKIQGVEFDWTEEHIQSQGGLNNPLLRQHDAGVIAQNVQQVIPEIVFERENGTLAVKYEGFIPYLIESINEIVDLLEKLNDD